MKKKLLCFILLFVVCIVLVIPKTNAFGIVESYEDESIYYAPFEYSINCSQSITTTEGVEFNIESITFPYDSITSSYSSTLDFNNNMYYEIYYNEAYEDYEFNYSITALQPYDYYYSARYNTYGDPSYFNIKMNIPMFVLNYDVSTMFSIQYYENYCIINEITATMDLRYFKNGEVYSSTESLNLIDSVDSDMLVYQPLLNTYNALSSKYGVSEFVVTNFNLILKMNSDSEYYIISHPLFENGYAFKVPYLVENVEEVVNPDFSSWLTSSLSGFFDFEIVEGWSFGVIFALIVAIPIILYLLKYFFGG